MKQGDSSRRSGNAPGHILGSTTRIAVVVAIALSGATSVLSSACSSSSDDTPKGPVGETATDTTITTAQTLFVFERPGDLAGDLATMYEKPANITFKSFQTTVATYGAPMTTITALKNYLIDTAFKDTKLPGGAEVWVDQNFRYDATHSFATIPMSEAAVLIMSPGNGKDNDWDLAPAVPAELSKVVSQWAGDFDAFSGILAPEPPKPPEKPKPGGTTTGCANADAWSEFPWNMGSGTAQTCPATVTVTVKGKPVVLDTVCNTTVSHPTGAASQTLFPKQLRAAYGVPETLRGAGRRATIVLGSAFISPEYLDGFAQLTGSGFTSDENLQQIAVWGLTDPQIDTSGELMIDTSMILGMAPDLDLLTVIAFPPINGKDPFFLQAVSLAMTFSEAINESNYRKNASGVRQLPDAVSISEGPLEQLATWHYDAFQVADAAVTSVLQMAAMMGVTFTASSGDGGAYMAPNRGISAAPYPASSPWITAVGGTNLQLDATDDSLKEIGVWNDDYLATLTTCAASGGGIAGGGNSAVFPKPTWQVAAGVDGSFRAMPDISAFADDAPGGFLVSSVANAANGTSMASPLAAGLMVLLQEKLVELTDEDVPHIGLATPLLYAMGALAQADKSNPQAFYDVVERYYTDPTTKKQTLISTNRAQPPVAGAVDCCDAKEGYDRATGWGSLNMPEAFDAWAALNKAAGP